MTRSVWRVLLAAALVVSTATLAFAQATTQINGVVKDSAGGVIPGATVVVKDNTTGATFEAVTGANGSYTIPALQAGTYTVTATLAGFKTAQVNNVRLALGAPATVDMTLEVGQLTDVVNVTASAELINTTNAAVQSTLNSDQLNRMPTPTRNALNAVTFLPGINTPGTNRDSTINGLPESFVQITMDGVSNNDNFLRTTDSFFASVTPRQDAVEAVTVTLAAAGAQQGGSGAITIGFQTRSGGNRFSGSLYEYFRSPELNSNYYFNEINDLPKNEVKLNQYGGRVGGPIYIPKVVDGRGKAFFFVNYEQIRFPNSFTRTRTVLHPRAVDGWFRYEAGGQIREVNVLTLGAANSALDPTVRSLLTKINAATATTGTVNTTADPLLNSYVWLSPSKLFEHQPTSRLDYNITDNHRLSGTAAVIWAERTADYLNGTDARFPGSTNVRDFKSKRPLFSLTLRSTLSSNVVNELRGGITARWGQSNFGFPSDTPSRNDISSFADQDGYAVDFDQNIGLTNWWISNGPSWRAAPTYSIANTVNWQRGNHSFQFGAEWLKSTAQESAQQIVPGINLGFNTQFDPAAGLFTTANFPSASAGQLTDARELFALLTGRVISVTGQAALDPKTNKYVAFGPRTRAGHIHVFSGFAQDSWRVTPTLTLNLGLRYDVQTPFVASNDIMSTASLADVCGISGIGANTNVYNRCNFLQPGANSGKAIPEFAQLTKGTQGYETDWNNFAPSVSVAWRPNVQDGWLRTILGNPDQATIRAGWSIAYSRHGMSQFTGVFGANPGSTITLTRDTNTGLVPAGEAWPVLFSQKNRLYNASFNETPTFPIVTRPDRADSISAFSPDLKMERAQTWNIGIQRSIGEDMAVEVRYVGTRGDEQWSTLNYNGLRMENLINNGFLSEFQNAMANLRANNAAGGSRAGSFAYFGAGSGTVPLPIYLAYFNGRTDATNAAAYTGGTTTWASTTFASRLAASQPNPTAAAGDLDGNLTRRNNALAAGLPANFFIPNPRVNNVDVTDSGAFSDYHALQIDLRRRLSKGLSASVNYQYAHERGSAFDGFSYGRVMVNGANVRHAIKGQWDWTIPVGRGQRFGANMHPVLDAILGGWSMNGVGRIQARVMNFGNVRLVGMSVDELTDMYKFYRRTNASTGRTEIWMLPEDVILNTRRAFSVSNTTADGYSASLGAPTGRYIAPANGNGCIQMRAGDCAPRSVLVRAPWFTRFDIGVTKRFNLKGTMNIEVRGDVLNLFDNINFNPVANPGTGATIFQVTSAYTDASNTYDPGGRLGQLMIRFNW